jgi:uncharacterized protein YgiM (DUF1202 family)
MMKTAHNMRWFPPLFALLLASLACNLPFGSTPPTPTPTEEPPAVVPVDRQLSIRADTATLRTGPGVSFESRGNLVRGQVVQVIGETPNGDWLLISLTPSQGGPGEAWISAELTGPVELAQISPTITMLPPEPPTSTFTAMPAFTATPEGQSMPITLAPLPTATLGSATITATMDTNCRAGTSTAFKALGFLTPADRVPVLGRSPDGFWWYIQNPDRPNDACWVWKQTTIVTGDVSTIPIVQPPPTPIPVDIPTATFTAVVTGQPGP